MTIPVKVLKTIMFKYLNKFYKAGYDVSKPYDGDCTLIYTRESKTNMLRSIIKQYKNK